MKTFSNSNPLHKETEGAIGEGPPISLALSLYIYIYLEI